MNTFMSLSSRDFGDLSILIQIKNAGSLTKAAKIMGVTQSALSQKLKALEDRLGVKLLARTTRSLSLTPDALEMIGILDPASQQLAEIIGRSKEKNANPSGRLRLTAPPDAAIYVLCPFLKEWLPKFPSISIELLVESSFRDLVRDGIDGGIRIGSLLEKDMVCLRLTGPLEMPIVASPCYLEKFAGITSPQDLMAQNCLNLLLGEEGKIWPWPLENQQTKEKVKLKPQGTFASTSPDALLQACLSGMGIACLPYHAVEQALETGKLKSILTDWMPVLSSYYLYYPDKRYNSAAFQALIAGLKAWRFTK